MLSAAASPPRAPLLARSRVPGRGAGRSHLQQHEVGGSAQVSPRPWVLRGRPLPLLPCSQGRAVLLRVLQDAPVPEVVDVTTEENQLGVRVLGHLAVQRGGILLRGRNHDGFPARDPFDSTLCQGTKSAEQSHRKS